MNEIKGKNNFKTKNKTKQHKLILSLDHLNKKQIFHIRTIRVNQLLKLLNIESIS